MNTTTSQVSLVFDFVRVLIREAINHKTWVAVGFAIVSLTVLAGGFFYPKKFVSFTTIHADQQNIIKPLLEGQATTTAISDQARTVREVVLSPRLLKEVVTELGLVEDPNNEYKVDERLNSIRQFINVENVGQDFIKIEFTSDNADETYNIVSKITDLFIRSSYELKKKESREAFLFIDKQVKTYKSQLQEAEEKLKSFTASNLDGSEESVKARISDLRKQIESARLDIEENETRIASLDRELAQESQFVEKRFKSDVYRERLLAAQAQLETLKLTYTDDYPDVVTLTHQIEDMKKAIRETDERQAQQETKNSSGGLDASLNPLYEELRSKIATQKVEVNSQRRRLDRTQELLKEEYARLERIANRQADLAELTRDYDVNKEIYENLLERKEKARMSMTLDVEGQGVNYRIQEPAAYPLIPKGLRFLHFVLLGPLLGVFLPIGVLGLYIHFDPRIRFRSKLEAISSVPILGVVPHIATPLSKRVLKGDVILLAGFMFIVMCVYLAIAVAHHKGIL